MGVASGMRSPPPPLLQFSPHNSTGPASAITSLRISDSGNGPSFRACIVSPEEVRLPVTTLSRVWVRVLAECHSGVTPHYIPFPPLL